MPPEVCPHCGETVPAGAAACPGCGSDAATGWSASALTDELGLPDEEFDYQEFVREEFGGGNARPRGIRWFWWFTALLLVLALTFLLLR